MNPLITTDEVRNGELLAQTDDAEYRLISVVYKLDGTDNASFYCSAQDWQQTEAGKTAVLYAEIARLRARVLELEAEQAPIDLPSILEVETIAYPYCPECTEGPFNTRKGWKAHRRIKHEVQ